MNAFVSSFIQSFYNMTLVSAEIFPQIALTENYARMFEMERNKPKIKGNCFFLKQPSNHQIINVQGILLGLRE